MKKFAVLLTTAILGSAALAAGTNMIQDEPGPDSRPARNVEKHPTSPFAPARADDEFGPVNPRGQSIQNDDPFGAPAYIDDRGMGGGYGFPGGMGNPAAMPGMGGPGMGMSGPGMGGGGGMSGPDSRYMRPRSVTRTIVEQRMEPLSKEEIAELKKLGEATRLLHESKDEEARKKAADTIREQLNAQFDRDLKRREKELADIEARLKTLREQVEKRKAARDRIVGLRLDTILDEADGLGFPSDVGGIGTATGRTSPSFPGGYAFEASPQFSLPGGAPAAEFSSRRALSQETEGGSPDLSPPELGEEGLDSLPGSRPVTEPQPQN